MVTVVSSWQISFCPPVFGSLRFSFSFFPFPSPPLSFCLLAFQFLRIDGMVWAFQGGGRWQGIISVPTHYGVGGASKLIILPTILRAVSTYLATGS